jgi:putative serine protease PepD
VARGVALVYFERPTGLGNPKGMPRPAPITEETPPYERERLEQEWDRYWHQQQVFYTDQPATAIVLDGEHLLTAASNLHGDVQRGRVLIDGASIDCAVLAVHRSLDLAVLRTASPMAIPPLELAARPDLRCGDPVAVVGRHRAAAGHTVSVGVVSATDRRLEQSEFGFHQTDAMADYGNLGGPVVDIAGAVVGMLVMLGPSDERPWLINSGVALFVDSATLRSVLPALLKGDSTESMRTLGLGVRIEGQEDSAEVAIKEVLLGTGAADAGLQAGDVITAVDGRPVHRLEEVTRVLVRHHIGDHVAVTVRRGTAEVTLPVELRAFGGEKP